MTRINLLEPALLSDKHLLAEYRELPRIFTLAYNAYMRGESYDTSASYVLGPGHVKFFYGKLGWLKERFRLLTVEMKFRGWSPSYDDVPIEYYLICHTWQNDWSPTESDIAISLSRLRERNPEHYA